MMARYYESSLGRFLSIDPSRAGVLSIAPQTWNRYTYSLNNPLTLFDPNGAVTQVAVGGATTQNGFGHVSIIINDKVYSYGTAYSGSKDWGVFRPGTRLTLRHIRPHRKWKVSSLAGHEVQIPRRFRRDQVALRGV